MIVSNVCGDIFPKMNLSGSSLTSAILFSSQLRDRTASRCISEPTTITFYQLLKNGFLKYFVEATDVLDHFLVGILLE